MSLALLVDDDVASRFLYVQALAVLNMEVLEAADGREAITLLETRTPDLLIIDVLLPGISGAEVVEWMRQQSRFDNLTCLVISAHPGYKESIKLGSQDLFLAKPVPARIMREIAQRAISSHQPS